MDREARCKTCLAPGGAWVPCSNAPKFTASVMGSNADWAKPKAVAFAALLVAIPIFVFTRLGTAAVTKGNGHARQGQTVNQ